METKYKDLSDTVEGVEYIPRGDVLDAAHLAALGFVNMRRKLGELFVYHSAEMGVLLLRKLDGNQYEVYLNRKSVQH